MATIRKQIIRLLETQECDARMISQCLKIREKEVYEHMPHITRSAAAIKKRLMIIPAECNSCGYQFKDRTKAATPGRCPKCKKERIEPPRFKIR
ncbi:MAG: transcriptional regulator [Desulfobacteraceae bacterium]|nr:transcriptional regulator [Desulfobacteraceae bacterium]MBC2753993.1 transcriptional regulator [Desulfobacteraceae bacterium]